MLSGSAGALGCNRIDDDRDGDDQQNRQNPDSREEADAADGASLRRRAPSARWRSR